jgi:hypothetical protein
MTFYDLEPGPDCPEIVRMSFIPGTLAEEGDPMDVLALVEEPRFSGCLIAMRRNERCATAGLDLFKSRRHNPGMKPDSVRTSVDVPRRLHRRLHEAAARQGCSARQLILRGIEHVVEQSEPVRPRQRLSLDPPLIAPAGRHIDLTNKEIYELIELP